MTGPPTERAPELVLGDLGEQEVIRRVVGRLAAPPTPAGPGDDAAIVPVPSAQVVATTDLLVQGVHFRFDWSSPTDVGAKAAVQNLADIAAMGARPTALLVGLAAPPELPVRVALGIADGLREACAAAGAAVVGGDLVRADQVVLAVTALGDLDGRGPVLRSGARPGDVVVLAGAVGRSAAGLWLLRTGRVASPEQEARWSGLLQAHRRPQPPLRAGVELARLRATAMCDVSDGLVVDAATLATASGVAIELDPAAAEQQAVDGQWCHVATLPGSDPRGWVLGGGEDHALLATVPAAAVTDAHEAGAVVIGRVLEAGAGLTPGAVVDLTGAPLAGGFDHFG